MVNFTKRVQSQHSERKIHPVEIYGTLDRKSAAGPLRPAQIEILNEWFDSRRADRDIIVKLHTGEGKTLIGLLILQSRINEAGEPGLFLCPTNQLVNQVKLEAEKFGIQLCDFDGTRSLPNDFLSGRKILVTTAKKLFNGKSVFGLQNKSEPVGTIVMDDSHACIDAIRDSFTIKVKRDHELYAALYRLFENDLKSQGAGTALSLEEGSHDSLLAVPYWSWYDKHEDALQLLSKFSSEESIQFTWPLLRDSLANCQCIFTGQELEISPYHIPIDVFGSFANARQRILMSATTQNDSFFIKGLGFGFESIQRPLTSTKLKWSGEKMLLIPWLMDDSLTSTEIQHGFGKPREVGFGIVALVSSYSQADVYKAYGSVVADRFNIDAIIQALRSKKFGKTVVIVNRYDGIDLPDESCRILILDGMPVASSLVDRYEEHCRPNSDTTNTRLAQKIEQGLGRSVRGEKDYCAVIITGSDLVKFVKSDRTSRYFSAQTRKQIDIGLEIAKMGAVDVAEVKDPMRVVVSLINQSLQRDEGWKTFYAEQMVEISSGEVPQSIHELLHKERMAEEAAHKRQPDQAFDFLQSICDHPLLRAEDRGWYLQQFARHKYQLQRSESNRLQLAAYNLNTSLLKPREGVVYKKVSTTDSTRLDLIRQFVAGYSNQSQLMIDVTAILDRLTFGTPAEKFESALKDLGEALGFISQRPDKDFKEGPDNLWVSEPSQYIFFECKSEVRTDRSEILKTEAGQMSTHCAWFNQEYGRQKATRVLIIPTRKLGTAARIDFPIRIMRARNLKRFCKGVKDFFSEFAPYGIKTVAEKQIADWIELHHLTIEAIEAEYTEEPVRSSISDRNL